MRSDGVFGMFGRWKECCWWIAGAAMRAGRVLISATEPGLRP